MSHMKVKIVNAYVQSALNVIAKETGLPAQRGGIVLEGNPYTTEDITAVIGVSGQLSGSLYLSMSAPVALKIIGAILGQEASELDELGQSGIAEMANVIAGTGGIDLAEKGIATVLSPPLVLAGRGARLFTLDVQRFVVPLTTAHGEVKLHVALRETL
jgi:chemotaxis protein CheX